MTDLSGLYEVTATTPMGNQTMSLTIAVDGDRFTGTSTGQMGTSDLEGSVSGDTLTWKQAITVPMPLTLDCTATITGDAISGSIDSGAFGKFPLAGKRVA